MKNVYIWIQDNDLVWHTDLDFAVKQGLSAKPDLTLTQEEFDEKYPLALKDGKIIFNAVNSKKLAAEIRLERDRRLNEILWRIQRYESQKALGTETTDTKEDYLKVLQYIQDLRDVPSQKTFPEKVIWPELKLSNEENKH